MTIKALVLSIIFVVLTGVNVQAKEANSIKQLAFSERWLSLLHINTQQKAGEFKSYVDDDSFFFAEDGKVNPKSELLATVSALKADRDNQCKFPARTQFLLEHIKGLQEQVKPTYCQEYLDWRKKLNTTKVVLVFASAQLNSPSSMYGHTFLRFDPDNVEQNSTYLSYAPVSYTHLTLPTIYSV